MTIDQDGHGHEIVSPKYVCIVECSNNCFNKLSTHTVILYSDAIFKTVNFSLNSLLSAQKARDMNLMLAHRVRLWPDIGLCVPWGAPEHVKVQS